MSIHSSIIFLTITTILITNITSCDINCNQCSDSKCIQCLNGYTLEDNTCIKDTKIASASPTSAPICTTRYCQSCNTDGECNSCRAGYTLINKKCYSTSCDIYGPCKYCSEFDCLKCESGFQVYYGFCEESEEVSNLRLVIIISIGGALTIITGVILGLCCLRHKRNNANGKTIAATMLKNKHIPSGQYIIVKPTKDSKDSIVSITVQTHMKKLSNASSISSDNNLPLTHDRIETSSSTSNESNTSVNSIDSCVICGEKKTLSFANCGCALCPIHSNAMNANMTMNSQQDKLICPQHQTIITESLIIKRDKKTKIKGNAISQLGITTQICPICNLSPGTNSFNCGCSVLLCSHCFNDNINVFKYKKCPGCGSAYNAKEKEKVSCK